MPHVRTVILTVCGGERGRFEAVESGADAYLLKNVAPQALYGTLRGVVQDEAAASPPRTT